jgi:hypothetical protein
LRVFCHHKDPRTHNFYCQTLVIKHSHTPHTTNHKPHILILILPSTICTIAMGLLTFIRKLFSSCACQSTSDDAPLPPPRLATLAQAPLPPPRPVTLAQAPLLPPPPPPPSRATVAAAAPPRPKRYSTETFITAAPRKKPVYRFSSSVYSSVPSKYPSIREQFPTVRSQCAEIVFCAEDYIKELESIPFSQFSTVESSKPRARPRLPSGMF